MSSESLLADVNEKLVSNGFQGMRLEGASGEAESRQLMGMLSFVLDHYTRRGQRIEHLATRSMGGGLSNSAPPLPASVSSSSDQANAELEYTIRSLRAEAARALKGRVHDLGLQLKQSEHRVRAKEAVAERLAERLKAQVDRERETRERDKRVFAKLERRPVRAGARCPAFPPPLFLSRRDSSLVAAAVIFGRLPA